MEEVNRIGGEAERNQLKRRTELIGKPSLVVYHRKNEGVSKCTHPLFYAQSPDFLKPELCYFLKFLYL